MRVVYYVLGEVLLALVLVDIHDKAAVYLHDVRHECQQVAYIGISRAIVVNGYLEATSLAALNQRFQLAGTCFGLFGEFHDYLAHDITVKLEQLLKIRIGQRARGNAVDKQQLVSQQILVFHCEAHGIEHGALFHVLQPVEGFGMGEYSQRRKPEFLSGSHQRFIRVNAAGARIHYRLEVVGEQVLVQQTDNVHALFGVEGLHRNIGGFMHLCVVILCHDPLICGVVRQLLKNGSVGYRRRNCGCVDIHAIFTVVTVE